jgi:ribosomal protein S5
MLRERRWLVDGAVRWGNGWEENVSYYTEKSFETRKKMILNVKYYEFPYKERGSKSAVTVTLAQQKVE